MTKSHKPRLYRSGSNFVDMPNDSLLINIVKPLWPDIFQNKVITSPQSCQKALTPILCPLGKVKDSIIFFLYFYFLSNSVKLNKC